jgi:UDP-glucose 4-epimerase
VFNIGADVPYSVNELARVVGRAFGVTPEIRYLPPRIEVVNAYSSHEKAAELLGARAVTSLEEGIARMAAWARAVGARKGQPFGEIEVRRNMPPSWTELESEPATAPPATPTAGAPTAAAPVAAVP